jgi:hypothetical protein
MEIHTVWHNLHPLNKRCCQACATGHTLCPEAACDVQLKVRIEAEPSLAGLVLPYQAGIWGAIQINALRVCLPLRCSSKTPHRPRKAAPLR